MHPSSRSFAFRSKRSFNKIIDLLIVVAIICQNLSFPSAVSGFEQNDKPVKGIIDSSPLAQSVDAIKSDD